MASIRHFPATHPLPDWRNFGVMLRVLLGINGLAALAALIQAPAIGKWLESYLQMAAIVEPLLLVSLGLLALLRDALWRLPLRIGQALVIGLAGALAGWLILYAGSLTLVEPGAALRAVLLAMATAGLLLAYFELRAKALSPAQAEARLAALNARIRPHFLFNSINAVLSLIRSEPRKAERALEDLAELFRVLMAENNHLSTLWRELELARNYLALEQLRLGERLKIDWHTDHAPMQAQLPPLILQPLLENAVYHGIEPHPDVGMISVNIYRSRNELHIDIRNPYQPQAESQHNGNKMAMGNIRERLALFFDAEASLKATVGNNYYQVHIVVPYRE